MTDLDILIPTTVEITVGGETITLQPLKVGQMPSFLRAISPAMQQLTAPEIDWLALFGERGDDLLTAIAIAAGKPRAWVNELAADEALLLAAKVIEVNADFFYPDGDSEARRRVRAGQESGAESGPACRQAGGWFDAVQRLIDHGHRLPDILNYTLGQVRGFLTAIERQEAANYARLLSLIALGARGDTKQLDKTLDRLVDHANFRPNR